ncbi:hypothetical protein PLESTB_001593700 [Pleodorina starrii]|uniref:Uncharacterized protein n=1 Tax=Pleodorina starrii TaxID=330485 RepID=A0A9W6BXW1_9CHLO|nr:hypothetical protein PLESTM_000577300 [Pleodorina starrii]GLC60279.1 hypothetical protein PLESTB_001593700 [Pleodorina starrii]GLC66041.1 hypothetical protein PLESTF_000375300 [Pleodorina starrii]
MAAQKTVADPPKTIFEAAERGLAGYITRTVERAIEFNINIRDKYQRTALHWAAEAGQLEAAECLLDYGVDPLATECNGRTAIHLAARAGRTDVINLLLEGRSPAEQETLVNQPDFFGLTPVFLALQRGEEAQEAFSLLMDRGGRYNQQSHTGKMMPTTDPADQPVGAAASG